MDVFLSMSLVCNFGGLRNLKFWEKVQYLVAQQFPAPVICFGCKYPIHISTEQFPAQIHQHTLSWRARTRTCIPQEDRRMLCVRLPLCNGKQG